MKWNLMTNHLERARQSVSWFFWGLLLISIPFTSSPIVGKLTGYSTVSPLPILPLAVLLILWFLPYSLRTRNIKAHTKPLLLFVLVVFLSCALTFFYRIFPIQMYSVLGREIRALITLAIGVGFYAVAGTFPRSENGIRSSLKFLYLGAVITLTWSTIQAYYIFIEKHLPYKLIEINRIFSIRNLAGDRLNGFAYEPSWLADQIVLLYIPFCLASVLKRRSAFSRNRSYLSVELILLIWGLIILFLSFSRIGYIAFFASIGVLSMTFIWHESGVWARRIIRPDNYIRQKMTRLLHSLLLIVLILAILAGIVGIVVLASRLNPRIEKIFRTDYLTIFKEGRDPAVSIYNLAENLAYAERVMYWEIGFRTFSKYPVLGVGLGNTGFFFQETMPDYAYHLPELIRIMEGNFGLPNPKNLWIKLLSETGIVGFIVFIVWLLVMGVNAWRLHKRSNNFISLIGLAGFLTLIAQIIEGFSLDSFALPQLWIMLGLLSSAISLERWPDVMIGKSNEA